jgi:hypothetical protein
MGDKWFNLLQACVIVGGLVWYVAVSSSNTKFLSQKVDTVIANQGIRFDKLAVRDDKLVKVIEGLHTSTIDNSVDIRILSKDVSNNTYRISRIEKNP